MAFFIDIPLRTTLYFLLRFPSLLDLAGLRKRDFSDMLRRLVLTLSLDAESIVLRPGEWTLVAVILLVM